MARAASGNQPVYQAEGKAYPGAGKASPVMQ